MTTLGKAFSLSVISPQNIDHSHRITITKIARPFLLAALIFAVKWSFSISMQLISIEMCGMQRTPVKWLAYAVGQEYRRAWDLHIAKKCNTMNFSILDLVWLAKQRCCHKVVQTVCAAWTWNNRRKVTVWLVGVREIKSESESMACQSL